MFLMLLSTASDSPRSLSGGSRASGLLWMRSPMGLPWPALSWANTCEHSLQTKEYSGRRVRFGFAILAAKTFLHSTCAA